MSIQTGPEYINHCRSLGFNDLEITVAMKNVGWQDIDIQAAFAEATKKQVTTKAPKKSKLWLWILLAVLGVLVLGTIGAVAWFAFLA